MWPCLSIGGRGLARVGRQRRAQRRTAGASLDLGEELRDAPAVEHVFEPRLLAVGPVAVVDEDADDRRRRPATHSSGLQQDAGVAGEVLWPVMPPSAGGSRRPGATAEPVRHRTALKPMSLVSSRRATRPPPSKAMLNLRGRPYSSRWLQDVVVQRSRERPGVDQLLRVDAGGRAAGDVADVVGAGAARGRCRAPASRISTSSGVARPDLADLQVGARGHVGVAAAQILGDRRHAAELRARSGCRPGCAAGT